MVPQATHPGDFYAVLTGDAAQVRRRERNTKSQDQAPEKSQTANSKTRRGRASLELGASLVFGALIGCRSEVFGLFSERANWFTIGSENQRVHLHSQRR